MYHSKNNSKEINDLRGNISTLVAFAGAGCSKILEIPLWNELLIELNKHFEYYDDDEQLISAIEKFGYAKVADNIEEKANGDKLYIDIIKKLSQPKSCYFTSLHLEIIRLTKTIITTNYDRSFEEALDAMNRLVEPPKFEYESFPVGSFKKRSDSHKWYIYHLHGDNINGEFVLSTNNYKGQYKNPSSDISLFIPQTYKQENILFIGFSFRDSYFVDFLKTTINNITKDQMYKRSIPKHFCLISDKITNEFLVAKDLLDMKITNIKQLIDDNILENRSVTESREEMLYFSKNAIEILNKYTNLEEEHVIKLKKRFDEIKANKYLINLLKELRISPLTFTGENFIEIEAILRSIQQSEISGVAESYSQN